MTSHTHVIVSKCGGSVMHNVTQFSVKNSVVISILIVAQITVPSVKILYRFLGAFSNL